MAVREIVSIYLHNFGIEVSDGYSQQNQYQIFIIVEIPQAHKSAVYQMRWRETDRDNPNKKGKRKR